MFSSVNVAMQVQGGSQPRLIRSAILDRDIFGAAPGTPKRTSWTMELLTRLDSEFGACVMDKPAFGISPGNDSEAPTDCESPIGQQIAIGRYDDLFFGAPEKPSALYREARTRLVPPRITLSSSPIAPELFIAPVYPPIAKLVDAAGLVSFTVDVNPEGIPSENVLVSGNRVFYSAVKDAIAQWRFPQTEAGVQVDGAISFEYDCPALSPAAFLEYLDPRLALQTRQAYDWKSARSR
ncbi:MAG: hypothetical protein WA715_01935 [Candidatus Acidiferrum sp.]